jgi:hypothetical protein
VYPPSESNWLVGTPTSKLILQGLLLLSTANGAKKPPLGLFDYLNNYGFSYRLVSHQPVKKANQ